MSRKSCEKGPDERLVLCLTDAGGFGKGIGLDGHVVPLTLIRPDDLLMRLFRQILARTVVMHMNQRKRQDFNINGPERQKPRQVL